MFSTSSFVLALGYCLLFFVTVCLLYKFKTLKLLYSFNTDKELPPASMGWPLVGHTLLWFYYMATPNPQAFVDKYILPYGETVTCSLFGRPTVVSVDPEFNKFVLQNEGRLFKASYLKSLHDIVGKYNMISVTGDLHRKIHGIAVSLHSNEKLRKNFMPEIQNVFYNTMKRWVGTEIVLHNECRRMFLSVMAKHLVDASTEIETVELYNLMNDIVNGMVSIPVEMLGGAYAKALKARKVVYDKLYKLMQERRRNPGNDILSKLVSQENLQDEVVVDLILSLIIGSYENAPTTMTFAVHFLSESPRALEQLIEEHETICKYKHGEDKFQWEDYKNMKFTQCVINETLRLSNIVMFLLRETMEDVTIKGYKIPKGCRVATVFMGVNLNDIFYNDALKFNPWRWQGVDKEELLWKNHDILFSPFGRGKRLCPGADLARISISSFLHYFVTQFRWKVVQEGRITHFPMVRIIGGLRVHLFAKSPPSVLAERSKNNVI
ncbi:hypothetical protein SUGI_0571030 [Cryptomeria japonica]|nr:hypothetical protein SUGI_0571030 [Cryptomeria japonica]